MTTKELSDSPKSRPYRLGQRQTAVDKMRAKIIEAERELIMPQRALAGFSVDAVAKQDALESGQCPIWDRLFHYYSLHKPEFL